MARLSIISMTTICAIMAALLAVTGGRSDAAPPGARGTIVLFGASWCAPCMVELRDIAKLAAAAAPDSLVVVWDDPNRVRDRLSRIDSVHLATPEETREIGAIVGEGRIGLPYAMMRGADGRKCAEWRGPLRAGDIAALRKSCVAR